MVDEKLYEKFKNLFLQKRYSELIFEIEKSSEKGNRPSKLLSLLGVCKMMKSNKVEEDIISGLSDFRNAYLQEKHTLLGLEGLINFINGTLEFKKKEKSYPYFLEAENLFLEAKKKFGYNEKLFIGMSAIYKRMAEIDKRLNILKSLIENNCKVKNIWCSYIYNNNFKYYWSQKDYFEFSKKFKEIIQKFNTKNFNKIKNSNDNKIKVGFLSSDFKSQHSITFFLENTLKYVDEKKFELFAFSNVKEVEEDETTYKFKKFFKSWHNINKSKNEKIIELIQNLEIDILIDLMGVTGENKLELFNSRISPIQICWLGYCNTIGLDGMDYLISDPNLILHEEEKFYSEKIIKLPKIWNSHSGINLERSKNPPPFKNNDYITFGSFNNILKISENTIQTWSSILKLVKKSKLIIKSSLTFNNQKIKKAFRENGVENSIIFLERSKNYNEHLNQYNKIDIALDTFPYNGVTTSFEAMWMGVPVLTVKGFNFNSRCGESINKNAGMDFLIAENEKDYINKALLLANKPEKIIDLRNKIYENVLSSPLFDSKNFSKDFWELISETYNKHII